MWLLWVTGVKKGLLGIIGTITQFTNGYCLVTRGYSGLQGDTGDYWHYRLLQQHEQQIYLTVLVRGLQGVIYRGLQ